MVTIPNQKLVSMVIQNEIKIQQGEQQNYPEWVKLIITIDINSLDYLKLLIITVTLAVEMCWMKTINQLKNINNLAVSFILLFVNR